MTKNMTTTIPVPVRPVLPDGAEFAAMRRLAGYRLEDVCVLANVSRSSLQAYEHGRTPVRSHVISGLAKAYRRFNDEVSR